MGAGTNGAILHYHQNTSDIRCQGELILVDAGCDFRYYASDITRTFPVGGKFTAEGRGIYELVLLMQKTVLRALKPGVLWEDMHRLAVRVAAQGLIKLGVLYDNDLEEILASGAVAVFFPHGLGHSIGLDVHDVGGYPKGVPRIQEPGIRYLRMRRQLVPGMVLTVEPGIYFSRYIIQEAKRTDPGLAKFINFDVAEKLVAVGGVRIEDSVVITSDGHENLTPLVKEVNEIEELFQ